MKGSIITKVVASNKDADGCTLSVQADSWISYNGIPLFYSSNGFAGINKGISLCENPQVYFINGIYSLHYCLLPLLKLKGRKIVSVRGMLHPGALTEKKFKKRIYLAVWKALQLHRKCEYHATSEHEEKFIYSIFGRRTKIWTIPNLPNVQELLQMPHKGDTLIIGTIALISPMKNILLVLQALQNCKSRIEYRIYGPVKDEFYWNECKLLIGQLPSNVKVKYEGELNPDAITNKLADLHIIVQPSKSENYGHSLLEALTAGRPIITSHHTPWNDLESEKAGMNVSTDETHSLTSAIEMFSQLDHNALVEWGKFARSYAIKRIDIENIKEQYIKMFSNI